MLFICELKYRVHLNIKNNVHSSEQQLEEEKATIRLIIEDTYRQLLFLLIMHGLTMPEDFITYKLSGLRIFLMLLT